jgi:hypothetical protein
VVFSGVSESKILEMQNSSLKQVSFTVACSDLWYFSGVSESEILEMQNSSLKQVRGLSRHKSPIYGKPPNINEKLHCIKSGTKN